MADVAAWVNYIPPVKGTRDALIALDPEIGENPLIAPTADVLSRAHVFRGLSADEEQKYTRLFNGLTTG
jgi:spermidine/putrescine transport system substrate-binding protein